MVTDLITFLIIIWGCAAALWLVVSGTGAFLYDAQEIHRQRRIMKVPNARKYRARPLISVLVTSHNNDSSIQSCLESLALSRYRKLEIILIDRASTDTTRATAKTLMKRFPRRSFRLVAQKTLKTRAESMEYAEHRYASGEIILILDAASAVGREIFHRAIERFNDEADLQLLQPNLRYRNPEAVAGLIQQYRQFLSYRTRKFSSVTHSVRQVPLEGIFVKRERFTALLQQGQMAVGPSAYAHNLNIFCSPVSSFTRLYSEQQGRLRQHIVLSLRSLRQPARPKQLLRLPAALLSGFIALLMPILITYFIYLAVRLREPSLLLISWGVLIGLLVISTWGDQQLSVRRKLGYISAMPLSFAGFYVLSFAPLRLIYTSLATFRR
jgi:hypothetical protein